MISNYDKEVYKKVFSLYKIHIKFYKVAMICDLVCFNRVSHFIFWLDTRKCQLS